jgi:hypothetical protein
VPRELLLGLLALFSVQEMVAQEIKPRAYFSKDTVQIGEHVDFTMVLDYPRGMEVLFPDSTYNYQPFEFLEKSYLSTVSNQSVSNDSVVYTLTSFELDSILHLSLPIFLITDGDSTIVESNMDQLILKQVITESIDSLEIQETIDYQKVSKAFNYPYLLIALAVLVTLGILVALFFGKEIKRKYQLHRLRKAHHKFLENFRTMQEQGLESSTKAEHLLAFWKSYLERLEGMPYTKLTTKEIVILGQNQEFNETLRSLDSNIYGDFKKSDINDLVVRLKEFGIDRFAKKIEELKHA